MGSFQRFWSGEQLPAIGKSNPKQEQGSSKPLTEVSSLFNENKRDIKEFRLHPRDQY